MSNEDRVLEGSDDEWVYPRTHRSLHGWFYLLSLAGLIGAAALGVWVSPFGGYTAGMLFAITAMLHGLRFWPVRFVERRWLPSASRLEVDALQGSAPSEPRTRRRGGVPPRRLRHGRRAHPGGGRCGDRSGGGRRTRRSGTETLRTRRARVRSRNTTGE